jgi:hypothetical protein
MNSRAWTEVATGAPARSTGRWLRKAAAPIILRYLVLLVLVGAVVLVLFPRLWPADNGPCLGCFEPPPRFQNGPRDLLDLIL